MSQRLVLLTTALMLAFASNAAATTTVPLPGLQDPVEVVTDRDGVPHLTATNDLDLARAQGFVHARDRFFQMDLTRREISGDLAEVLGLAVLGRDVQNRTVGLRRAAERTLPELSAKTVAVLEAYAEGVNAYLDSHPLPPEYAALGLSSARPWSAVDSVALAKGLAANLSLDIDIDPTLELLEYMGILGPAAGQALYFEDVRRSAPMDPAATVPDAGGTQSFLAANPDKAERELLARAAGNLKRARDRLAQSRLLAAAMNRRQFQIGSNEWGVSASKSATGRPIIANDPHLALDTPSTFYEWRLVVTNDPDDGPMNASGVSFPGAPGVILGQNQRITWGATTNGLDVSDIFNDTLVVDPFVTCAAVGSQVCIVTGGVPHPVESEVVDYFVNIGGTLVPNPGLSVADRTILTVPFRSFGPIVDVTDPGVFVTGGSTTALVLQYTGFHPTREIETFLAWNRAQNLSEFLDGLENFDVGAQNWAYADADGNLGYFSSAESPLRADLEAGAPAGLPPAFIRDLQTPGSGAGNWLPDPGQSQGQAIPFEVLPFSERPQLVNPPGGFFVNANNDAAGVTLDNNALNQARTSDPGAIYYLAPSYANGLRAGRITRLIEQELAHGKITEHDMKRFQANTQQLDAELMRPFLLQAFAHGVLPGAPAELHALASDGEVAEAVFRLLLWNFSTPTGIREGWDATDPNGRQRPGVPLLQRKASVAATLYNVWRGKLIARVIDQTLAGLGVSSEVGSSDALKALFQLLSEDPFDGVGASGVNFFPAPVGLSAEERRDVTLLAALRDALDALASAEFAPAFGGSTDQDDYRWGKLHRITFDHPLGAPFSIPPAAGFSDLAPDLPGLSRDGGYEVVNASGFSARAASLNGFRFGSGPVRRYVGTAGFPVLGGLVRGFNVVPGGKSGVLGDPLYANQLGTWLTADYHRVRMSGVQASARALSTEQLIPVP